MADFDIVVNPAGASGKTLKSWQKIEPLFKQAGVNYQVHFSRKDYRIDALVHDLTKDHKPVNLVIVGGDGTMNEAINGIEDFSTTRIGLIPAGSGNDLAKGLGLSRQIEQLTRTIMEARTVRTIDIGELIIDHPEKRLNEEKGIIEDQVELPVYKTRFNVSSGVGFDADICLGVILSKAKKRLNKIGLGKLIYLFVAVRLIFHSQNVPIDMEFDGQRKKHFKQALFTAGMNHPYEGGGFKFCPFARDDDGKLDFVIADGISSGGFFRIFPYCYSGKHLKFKGVNMERAEQVRIHSDIPLWVHADGEVKYAGKDIQMGILPEKLQMLD